MRVVELSAMIALCLAAPMMPGQLTDRNSQYQPQELGDNQEDGMGGKGEMGMMGGKGGMMGGKGKMGEGMGMSAGAMQEASNRVDSINNGAANMFDKILAGMSPEDRKHAENDELFNMARGEMQMEINEKKTEGMSPRQKKQLMEQRLADNLGWDDNAVSDGMPGSD